MEGDIPEETVLMRADLGAVLSGLPLFMGLDVGVVRQIGAAAEWLSLPGGATLFRAGARPDEAGARVLRAGRGRIVVRVPG